MLYGMISAIGVRNVVENKTNFQESRNVIVAAIILGLAVGINFSEAGGIPIVIGDITINMTGLAVASIVGILLNAVLPGKDYYFAEEPDETLSRHEQLRMLLKASLSVDNLREETAAKAQAFEGNYKKMVRFGFLAIIIIPLIFLVLMFSLESKIVFLVLWILSIIIIAVWLIVVEFIHNNLQEQQKIAGMSFDEMLEKFRGKEEE